MVAENKLCLLFFQFHYLKMTSGIKMNIKNLILAIILLSFINYPTFSMYIDRNERVIREDLFNDDEEKTAIRRYNRNIIQQKIERAEEFWDCCSKIFSFFTYYCSTVPSSQPPDNF